ncbi:MAG: hypothetical protein WAQ98_25020 [Blastocatellia bacterium]
MNNPDFHNNQPNNNFSNEPVLTDRPNQTDFSANNQAAYSNNEISFSNPENTLVNHAKYSYAQTDQAENQSVVDSTQSLPWTKERIQFTITNCSFAIFLASLAATMMFYSQPTNRFSEMLAVFIGQAIGGGLLGFATSLVLWQEIKSNQLMGIRIALSNLFILFLNIPIGIAIAVCLYTLFSADASLTVRELVTAPLKILGLFYWVPFVLIPPALACWGAETFLVNRYFANFIPDFASLGPKVSDLPPTTFAVKRSNTATRCEICHQDDMFTVKTAFCRRCQRYSF